MPTCVWRHRTTYLRLVVCWDGGLQFQCIILNNPCVDLIYTFALFNIPSSIRSIHIQLLIHARKQQCCNSIRLLPCNWQAQQGQRGKAEVRCFLVCLVMSVLCWCLGFLCMFLPTRYVTCVACSWFAVKNIFHNKVTVQQHLLRTRVCTCGRNHAHTCMYIHNRGHAHTCAHTHIDNCVEMFTYTSALSCPALVCTPTHMYAEVCSKQSLYPHICAMMPARVCA
jgi:hypothetical protein